MNDNRLGLPSASEVYRLSKCCGSKILIDSLRTKGISLDFKNVYASLGERIHASLEGDPETLERKAQDIRDDCDRIAKSVAFEFMPDPIYETLYEQRLWYTLSDVPFFSGKPDRACVHPEKILDVNFKTGRGEEEDAHLNLQLRTEAALLNHAYPNVPEIGVAIVQPLATHTPEIAVYGRKEILQAEAEILGIVDKAAWDPKRRAGVWCKHCPGRAFCPEAREMAINQPITISVDDLPSGESATEIMNRLNVSYDVLDALWDAFSKKVSSDPESVPGWRISSGKKVRGLPRQKEIELAERAVENGMSVDGAMKFSITAFEEISAQAWKLKGVAFKRKFEHVFGDLFEIRQDAGYLEKVPKRLKDKQESV